MLAEGWPLNRVIVMSSDRTGTVGEQDLKALSPNVGMIRLPSQAPSLERAIIRARFGNWTTDLEDQVRAATHMPALARQSILWILQRRLRMAGHDRDHLRPTQTEIAHGIGYGPRALGRLARSNDLQLEALSDAWAAVQIQAAHEIDGATWKRLARSAGYEGGSGLTRLFLRVFEQTPSESAGRGIEPALQRFESAFARALAK
jgi:hypothetical protein